ncbi:MAG: thioesterase family protein [Rhodospirillales bacterium]|nr:thioesterase family protein [Rhodospirillales bacterium]MCW8862618.1 thioesterase family protein [Rhodospirillales bacterium]MCW8952350.1 thioesterase family protein [Rhodospirillales bacterium]MCW8970281.1 thioesterase family protein [Rhodospirillales bacterium]MCW9003536.1 thioesterase family protein [Rhodospirillales bacterium]
MTEESAPFFLHREKVRPEWIDYNGHMNVAYYTLTFDHATDALFNYLDLGIDYVRRAGCSLFSAEAHTVFKQEVAEGASISFTAQLLGADEKRVHVFLRMFNEDEGYLAATIEFVSIHVDMQARRATPLPEEACKRVNDLVAAHASLPVPPEAGRAVTMTGRKNG